VTRSLAGQERLEVACIPDHDDPRVGIVRPHLARQIAMLPRPANDPDEERDAEPLVRAEGTAGAGPTTVADRPADQAIDASGERGVRDDDRVGIADPRTERRRPRVAAIDDPRVAGERIRDARLELIGRDGSPVARPVQLVEMDDRQVEGPPSAIEVVDFPEPARPSTAIRLGRVPSVNSHGLLLLGVGIPTALGLTVAADPSPRRVRARPDGTCSRNGERP